MQTFQKIDLLVMTSVPKVSSELIIECQIRFIVHDMTFNRTSSPNERKWTNLLRNGKKDSIYIFGQYSLSLVVHESILVSFLIWDMMLCQNGPLTRNNCFSFRQIWH